jgi:hypothetical protein
MIWQPGVFRLTSQQCRNGASEKGELPRNRGDRIGARHDARSSHGQIDRAAEVCPRTSARTMQD